MTGIEARVFVKEKKSFKVVLKQLVNEGKTTREIADQLEICDRSVRLYAKKYGIDITHKEIANRDWGWTGIS